MRISSTQCTKQMKISGYYEYLASTDYQVLLKVSISGYFTIFNLHQHYKRNGANDMWKLQLFLQIFQNMFFEIVLNLYCSSTHRFNY